MSLSKSPSQKHDKQKCEYISCHDMESLTRVDSWFLPFRCPPFSLWVSEPKGKKKGGIWGHFLMATFRKTEGERYREKKERRETGQGKREGGRERFPFKSPNFVVATMMGEDTCSVPRTGLEN